MSESLLVAILAAGGSRRLGRPKQLELLDGETLIHRQCRIAIEAKIGDVVVVVGNEQAACTAAVEDLPATPIVNGAWADGMSTSLHAVVHVAHDRNAAALLVLLCDQYGVTSADLRRLVATWSDRRAATVAARHDDAAGPPAIFPRTDFTALLGLRGDAGARGLLSQPGTVVIDLVGAGLDVDDERDANALRQSPASDGVDAAANSE